MADTLADPLAAALRTTLQALSATALPAALRENSADVMDSVRRALEELVAETGQTVRLGSCLDRAQRSALRVHTNRIIERTMVRAHDGTLDPRLMLWRTPVRPDGVALTEKERDVILELARAGQRTLTRQDLLSRVWGYARDAETHTVETHIYRLRQKIEPDPAHPIYIQTVEEGYRLSPPL